MTEVVRAAETTISNLSSKFWLKSTGGHLSPGSNLWKHALLHYLKQYENVSSLQQSYADLKKSNQRPHFALTSPDLHHDIVRPYFLTQGELKAPTYPKDLRDQPEQPARTCFLKNIVC